MFTWTMDVRTVKLNFQVLQYMAFIDSYIYVFMIKRILNLLL